MAQVGLNRDHADHNHGALNHSTTLPRQAYFFKRAAIWQNA